jgi:GNAT superfamily N-acetyltransferase
MEVREATVADATEVLAFVRAKAQFDRELGAFAGDLGTSEELVRQHLFGPRPVAFALYYFRYSSFRGRPSVWLDDLYVHPPSRRRGAGRLLMARLAEVAEAADCTHIAWVASASNAVGMGFYRRIGATVAHQAEEAVTLQVEPAALLGTSGPAGRGAAPRRGG